MDQSMRSIWEQTHSRFVLLVAFLTHKHWAATMCTVSERDSDTMTEYQMDSGAHRCLYHLRGLSAHGWRSSHGSQADCRYRSHQDQWWLESDTKVTRRETIQQRFDCSSREKAEKRSTEGEGHTITLIRLVVNRNSSLCSKQRRKRMKNR